MRGRSSLGFWSCVAAGAAVAAMLGFIGGGAAQEAQPAKIFVPPPTKGNETLDGSGTGVASPRVDTIVTLPGDVINGNIIKIDKEGKLQLTGPSFDGAVKMVTTALDRVTMRYGHVETGDDEVTLSNGDRIKCRVAAMTPEAVMIESSSMGSLKIPRQVLNSVTFGKGITTLVESRFAEGQMAPWECQRGSWTFQDGCLVTGSTGYQTLFVKLEQKEAVTLVLKVSATNEGYGLRLNMALFADSTQNYYGQNSVYATFHYSEYYLSYVQNNNVNQLTNRSFGRQVNNAELRFSYDPETSKARVWMDAQDLGECQVPVKYTVGNYVLVTTQAPCKIERLNVLPGVVPPSQQGLTAQGEEEAERIQFTNKDRVSAAAVTLAEGNFLIQTSFGELKCPLGKVDNIVFRKKGREVPRRRKGDVQVETTGSRLTIRFLELTEENLVGDADHFGEVKIRRDAVKGARFNIYSERRSDVGKGVVPNPGGRVPGGGVLVLPE